MSNDKKRLIPNPGRSSILTESSLNRCEQQYWTMKLNELKTYADWDKQYIMDSSLRDAIILRKLKELETLIELGADVNCNTFSQVDLFVLIKFGMASDYSAIVVHDPTYG